MMFIRGVFRFPGISHHAGRVHPPHERVLMPVRYVALLFIVAVCLAAAPAGPHLAVLPKGSAIMPRPNSMDELPSQEAFPELLKTDPLRAFDAILERCQREVQSVSCVMYKQERISGSLGAPEIIDVTYRQEPYAVIMSWRGNVGFGKPSKTLYAQGENQGMTRVKLRIGTMDVAPDSSMAKTAARYTIEEFGFYYSTLRTVKAWSRAKEANRFHYEFVGTVEVPECGNRLCHVIQRTCDPAEVDNFSLAETTIIDPATRPKDAFTKVKLMFDAETWLQVGSVMTNDQGDIIGAYYFQDVQINPSLPNDQFTPEALAR